MPQWKIFGVNDGTCINDIQKCFGYLPIDVEIDAREVGFLHKLSTCIRTNYLICLLYNIRGNHEREVILTSFSSLANLCFTLLS